MRDQDTIILIVLLFIISFFTLMFVRENEPVAMPVARRVSDAKTASPTARASPPRETEIVDIYEATVRRYAGVGGLYFISVKEAYRPRLMRRLADLKNCLPVSDSNLATNGNPIAGGIQHRATGAKGLLIVLGDIDWKNDTHVTVRSGTDLCTGTGGAYGHCDLEKRDGRWHVVDCKVEVVS